MTLIELLVAVGIIALLTAFLVPGLIRLQDRARQKKTRALIKAIETALGAYHSEFRAYPPDGYDNPTADGIALGRWADGQPRVFKGSGCLVYFLTRSLTHRKVVGSDPRRFTSKPVGPFLTSLSAEDFSIEGFSVAALNQTDGAALARVEIVDAWGRPLCYDRSSRRDARSFQPGLFDGDVFGAMRPHWLETRARVFVDDDLVDDDLVDDGLVEDIAQTYDPRRPQDPALGRLDLSRPARPQNKDAFDLWSRGERWSDPNDDIGTFTIR